MHDGMGALKMTDMKMQDVKMQDMKLQDRKYGVNRDYNYVTTYNEVCSFWLLLFS